MKGSARTWITAAVLGLGVPAAVLGVLRFGVRTPPRPNIVVLLWDTTRADRLTPYGYARETTPWLRTVAEGGVVFEQCRAPSPWTLPSHASLFTGLLPRVHGADSLDGRLAADRDTLAERLKEAGYDTLLLTNNPLVGPVHGLDQGFDRVVEVWKHPEGASAARTVEHLRAELAARRNDADRAGRPLFLFVNLMEPHLPYEPPAAAERPWRPDGATEEQVARLRRFSFPLDMAHNLGVERLPPEDVAVLSSLYDGELLTLDAQCAALETALRDGGLLEDADAAAGRPGTLLVITSDHGENLGEKGLLDHKLSLADALLHVPLVMRWTGRLPEGKRVAAQVRLQDLFPTLLEAANVTDRPADSAAAASLLALDVAPRPVLAEFPAPRTFLAVMNARLEQTYGPQDPSRYEPFRRNLVASISAAPERWKALLITVTTADGSGLIVGRELHSLADDPGERKDLMETPTAEMSGIHQRVMTEAATLMTGGSDTR